MAVDGLTALIMLLSLVGLSLPIVVLADLVKRPSDAWAGSGQNQMVWTLVIVFFWFIGPILYLLIARPSFDAASVPQWAVDGAGRFVVGGT